MGKNHFEYSSIAENVSRADEYIARCEQEYQSKITDCAAKIVQKGVPLVLLAGPSGSGKTTTALKLKEEIMALGHPCYVVSMDDYFTDVNFDTHPRGEDGKIDFESPFCLDVPLFNAHMEALSNGDTIRVPHFDFPNQRRHPDMVTELNIGKNGLCIFEGIHALNPMFSKHMEDDTQKVYISARADIIDHGTLIFKGTWVRLIRRLIRDNKFRGWDPQRNMNQWDNVRRGEKAYISLYKSNADMAIDTHMPYETCALKEIALPLFEDIPEGTRAEELRMIPLALDKLPGIPASKIPRNSLLREFIG